VSTCSTINGHGGGGSIDGDNVVAGSKVEQVPYIERNACKVTMLCEVEVNNAKSRQANNEVLNKFELLIPSMQCKSRHM
jgi:hypothetical protein